MKIWMIVLIVIIAITLMPVILIKIEERIYGDGLQYEERDASRLKTNSKERTE